jgi:TonB-linked SusC/RagA family outer membrane protein
MTQTPWGEDTNLAFNGGWLGSQFMRFNVNADLSYKRIFGDHNVDAALLYNLSRTKTKGANNTYLYMDFAFRGSYDYAGKYFASVVANYSGSAKLEKGRKFRLYPAVSLGWLISKEDFMSDSDVVSHLKLRASYGVVGYDGRLTYDMDKQFNQAGGSYIFQNKDWLGGLMQGAIPSTNIMPETDYKADLGVEFGMFDNSLMFQLEGFYNNRKNIACDGSETVSEVLGVGVPIIFTGETVNYGAELSATWRKTIGDFSYNIGGNISYSKNRIIEAAEGHVPYEWQRIAGTQIGEMYGYEPVGFYQQEDFNADGTLKDGVVASGLISTLRPGDVKYNDLNEDGIIDENDAKYHGASTWPSLYYGINIGMEYKNFGFQAMFQGAGDFMVYTNLANVYQPLYNNDKNVSKHYLESYWTADSPQGRYPRLTTESNAHNYANSPVWWEKGDYLKLRNLYVWYDFGKYINKIDSFRLFFKGHNLFSIDSIKIMDPEHVSLAYPTARSFQLGLKLTF